MTKGWLSISHHTEPWQNQSNPKTLGRGYTMEESLHPLNRIKGFDISVPKAEINLFYIHRK